MPAKKKKTTALDKLKAEVLACRRAIDELKEQNEKKVLALSAVSNTIASDMYLEEILSLLMRITSELMNSNICSLMLLDKEKGELVLRATQSLSKEYLNKPNVKIGESVSGRVVKDRKPIVIRNVQEDPKYNFPQLAKRENLFSLLSVPLIAKGKVIGVLNSYKDHVHEFNKSEIALLSSVANQAAVAIQNTTLMKENAEIEEKLETRKIVEKAKGILMKLIGVGEEDAYRMIQKQSMDRRKSMREIADAIIISKEMNK